MRTVSASVSALALALAALSIACDVPLEFSGGGSAEGLDEIEQPLAAARTPVAVERLRRATEGLLFLSESDYPFEVLHWGKQGGGKPEAARVAALAGEDPLAPVEERTLDDFFRGATTPLPEHTPDDLATVERYRALVALVRRELRHVRVFRFGEVQIHAYVVGVTKSGHWVALSTIQIET